MMRPLLSVLVLLVLALSACSTSRSPLDGGGAPLGNVDPVGTWESCSVAWSFASDGSAARVGHADGCSATGSWSISGGHLTVVWDAEPCSGDPSPLEADVLRGEASLSLLLAGTDRPSTFLGSATVQVFTMTDDAEPSRRTTLRVVGDPERSGSGCYWAEDRACGGLLSCSGRLLQWRASDDGSIQASTSCTGDCPCGAVLSLVPSPTGYAAHFVGVNCSGTFEGDATMVPDGM